MVVPEPDVAVTRPVYLGIESNVIIASDTLSPVIDADNDPLSKTTVTVVFDANVDPEITPYSVELSAILTLRPAEKAAVTSTPEIVKVVALA